MKLTAEFGAAEAVESAGEKIFLFAAILAWTSRPTRAINPPPLGDAAIADVGRLWRMSVDKRGR
jgi:hypothetical protein